MRALAAETTDTRRALPDADKVWLKAQWAAAQENEARVRRRRTLVEAIPLTLLVVGIVALATFGASALGPLESAMADLTARVVGSRLPALSQPLVLLAIALGLPLVVFGATSEA